MDTIRTAAASVIGARHLRAARNGQDAVAVVVPALSVPSAVVVVCDGCSSGESSEVGARLGANLFARAIGIRLQAGASPCDPAMWADARAEAVAQLGVLADQLVAGHRDAGHRDAGHRNTDGAGDQRSRAEVLADVVRQHFLFTVVAAAVRGDDAAVWALGDGVYSFGDYTRELGPFADNAPPYLGYDLLDDPRPAHFEVAHAGAGTIVIGTDGAADIIGGIERFAGRRYVEHPDALRRELSVLAKSQERIDWDERRVIRTPATLQDDCAIAVLRWDRARAAASWGIGDAEVLS